MKHAASLDTEVPSAAEADPLAAATALLREAEVAAAAVRADADRYARRREHEADLVIAKARRVLGAAEAKASAIVTTARANAHTVIDLDAMAITSVGGLSGAATPRLDGMLATAIGNAVDDMFPTEHPAS
jgi:hypothetical protein